MRIYGGQYKGIWDPSDGVLGRKYYNVNGIWALKPCYLGPWTLRAALHHIPCNTRQETYE